MSSIVISHSEVDTYLLCPQRHYYAFGDTIEGADSPGMEPRTFSDPLYRGIVGHKGQEMFWKAIESGSTLSDATSVGIAAVQAYAMEPNPKYDILTDLSSRILPTYFGYVATDWINKGWRVKAVEHTFRLTVPTDRGELIYPFKPDLVIRDPMGRNWVADHKFIYNFFHDTEIDLLPQLPKYIGSLRALGFPVHGGIYNMLRWRKVKDTSLDANFRQVPFEPTTNRIRQAFTQQVKGMEKIASLKDGALDEWKNTVNFERVQNSMICKSCSFKKLCAIEMNGGNGVLHRKLEYRPNTYGYSESEASDGD